MKYSKVLNTHYDRLSGSLSGKSSFYARRHLAQVHKMALLVESLEQLAANRRPSETEEGHLLRIAQAAEKLKAQREKINEAAHDILREGITDIEDQIDSQIGLVPNQYASEIRAAFRNMTNEQRSEALYQATKSGDGAMLAAILDAPTILTGVSDDIKARTREALAESKAPELVARRNELLDSFDVTLAAMSAFKSAATEGFDPNRLREIEQAEAAHTEKAKAFESALSSE